MSRRCLAWQRKKMISCEGCGRFAMLWLAHCASLQRRGLRLRQVSRYYHVIWTFSLRRAVDGSFKIVMSFYMSVGLNSHALNESDAESHPSKVDHKQLRSGKSSTVSVNTFSIFVFIH